MIISSMAEAEEFVKTHKGFSWDGWNIVRCMQDDYAEYLSTGFFDKENGKWYQRTVFELNADGWIIPETYIRMAAKK